MADLPSDFIDFQPSSMSSSARGFFAASGYRPTTSVDVAQKVFTSRDGRKWRERTPEGMSTTATVQSLASHGSTTWLLGGQGFPTARTAVWTTEDDGSSWTAPLLLPTSQDVEVPVAISAGERGALVITKVTPGLDKPVETDARLRAWLAEKSGRLTQLWETPCVGHEGSEAAAEALVADDGFYVLTDCVTKDFVPADRLFRSTDGQSWKAEPLPDDGNEFDHMARNGDTMVLTGGLAAKNVEHTTDPRAWYRKDGGHWRTASPLDVGRLPDAGVVRRESQTMLAVTAAGSGFVAIGSARAPDDSAVGATWFSADGTAWVKQPTRANGFDQLRSLAALTARNTTLVVLGSRRAWETSDPAHARIWIGDIAPAPRRAPSSADTAPLARFAGTWSWSGATITIAPDGSFTYRYSTLVQCSDHAPPCDDGDEMGGEATGTLRQGRTPDEAVGTVDVALPNAPAGSPVRITREPYSAIDITVGKHGYGLFCEPGASRCAAPVGAG
ncbi:hypothetical protein AB9128_05955 [Streptomyces cinereoruber]|uniref:hypothetical protein n=1 Tax=Streptomyces cinereoruber TaxID=67260 RepID=UPI003EB9178A